MNSILWKTGKLNRNYATHTVLLLSFRTDCAERILRAPSGSHPQKHVGASLDMLFEWVEQYLWFVAWNKAVWKSCHGFEYGATISVKFCFKAGISATETLQMVNAAYGDQALSRSNVFLWYERFHDGREDIEDDSRSGRPTECCNDNNVEKISQLLLQNRHLSLRMPADEVTLARTQWEGL